MYRQSLTTMLISASRRTDLPAFYSDWFINRVRQGYCTVPNPFNPAQVTRVPLCPQDVDVIVFWTRNPRPLFPYLRELDELGYRYYFQYTLIGNPFQIDPGAPPQKIALATFRELASRIGPQRVIWRYDPVVISTLTPPSFHHQNYATIAQALRGSTLRSVVSLMDDYPKIRRGLRQMQQHGAILTPFAGDEAWFASLMRHFVDIAAANGMQIFSCAEELDLRPYGILPGKCVDDQYIRAVFGLDVTHAKDSSQRKACGCVVSKDIGMYDSCLFGCRYCYATHSLERARQNRQQHDPTSPSLLGWHEA